ncbi:hypothetical protein [Streptomyces sp. AC555_RSS877]|uniref:hypothetical protein n=1 Tax=Streptomyces sp. AC555_RSS877 TaxID=2823688 RepID=UPI001C27165D|nr:hypothetical protein [Streptomyces sp. AC555_RSS877]
MVATAVISASALVAMPNIAAADTGDTVSASEIASALGNTDRKNGSLVEEPVPSKTDADSAAVVSQNGTSIEVPKDPENGVSLQGDGAPEISISLPEADASKDAVKLADGTVAYPGTNSAQAVIPAKDGVQMLTTITNADAPTRYGYKVSVPGGGRVVVSPNNAGAVVLDGAGKPAAVVPAPWAKDTRGTAVPTHFETDGTTLTQVVQHASGSYGYPVVADPKYYSSKHGLLVQFSKKTTRDVLDVGGAVVTGALGLSGWIGAAVGATVWAVARTNRGKCLWLYRDWGSMYWYVWAERC